VPCVVASVCDSKWLFEKHLASVGGVRGDPLDQKYGGYNLIQPGIVCDLSIPGDWRRSGEEVALHPSATPATPGLRRDAACRALQENGKVEKPGMLFFGPPNDPEIVRRLLPRLQLLFDVDFVGSASEGVSAAQGRRYAACVAKLGTAGNLGCDIMVALRHCQGTGPFLAIHSATAAANPRMREKLQRDLSVNLFVAPGGEEELLEALAPVAEAY